MSLTIQHHYHTPRSMGAQRYIVAHDGVLKFNNSIGEQLSRVAEHGTMCMVIDGMSGLQNDRLAVEVAVQMFIKLYMFNAPHFDIEHLRMFVGKGHQEIRECMNEQQLPLMGCSFSLLWFFEGNVKWLSLGSTSIYMEEDGVFQNLSHPHTIVNLVIQGLDHRIDQSSTTKCTTSVSS